MRYPAWNERLTLVGRCAVLTSAIGVATLPFGGVSFARYGTIGLGSTLVAAAICLVAFTASLMMVGRVRRAEHRIHAILAGMFVETAIPLVAGASAHNWAASLAEAGLFGSIVAFYLASLAVKTLLLLPLVTQDRAVDRRDATDDATSTETRRNDG